MKNHIFAILVLSILLLPEFMQAQRIHGPEKPISKFKKDNDNVVAQPGEFTELTLQKYLGDCGVVSNLSFIGTSDQYGTFENQSGKIGLKKGLIITNGKVSNANGPNVSNSISTSTGSGNDTDLATISKGGTIYDVGGFEFNLLATKDVFSVWAVFGSEEYPVNVGSSFNDLFGVFIEQKIGVFFENIALVPGANIGIKINTINSGVVGINGNIANLSPPFGSNQYAKYYIDNPVGSVGTEYNGFTVPILIKKPMMIGKTYHIKFAICDISDELFDSGLFISSDSFQVNGVAQAIADFKTSVCDNTVTFYNKTKYADEYLWDFGDGTQSTEANPAPHTYQDKAKYNIKLSCNNKDNLPQTITKTISLDSFALLSDLQIGQMTCDSMGSLSLKINTDAKKISYKWSDQALANTMGVKDCIIPIERKNLEEGNYSLELTLNGQVITLGPYNIINPSNLKSVTANIKASCADKNAGEIQVFFGPNQPSNIDWSHDDSLHDPVANYLKPGEYQISVTDDYGCIKSYDFTVPEAQLVIDSVTVTEANCKGTSGEIKIQFTQNTVSTKCELYNASKQLIQIQSASSNFHFTNLVPGKYFCKISNSSGCENGLTIYVLKEIATESKVLSTAIIEGIIPKLIISSKNGTLPLTYNWSDGYQGSTRLNVNANKSYQVTVTDASGCIEIININKGNPHTGLGGLIAYPVPGNQYVNIRSQNEAEIVDSNLWTCIVTDASGKVIKLEKNVTQDGLQLNTSSLPNGLYFVHIQSSTDRKVLVLPVLHR